MSLIISNIALHFLTKKEETGEVVLRLGPESIEFTNKIENFVDALHKIYNAKASKAYGHFSTMPAAGDSARFVDIMESYLGDAQSFYAFSSQAANLLKNELEKYNLVNVNKKINVNKFINFIQNYKSNDSSFFYSQLLIPLFKNESYGKKIQNVFKKYFQFDFINPHLLRQKNIFDLYKDNHFLIFQKTTKQPKIIHVKK